MRPAGFPSKRIPRCVRASRGSSPPVCCETGRALWDHRFRSIRFRTIDALRGPGSSDTTGLRVSDIGPVSQTKKSAVKTDGFERRGSRPMRQSGSPLLPELLVGCLPGGEEVLPRFRSSGCFPPDLRRVGFRNVRDRTAPPKGEALHRDGLVQDDRQEPFRIVARIAGGGHDGPVVQEDGVVIEAALFFLVVVVLRPVDGMRQLSGQQNLTASRHRDELGLDGRRRGGVPIAIGEDPLHGHRRHLFGRATRELQPEGHRVPVLGPIQGPPPQGCLAASAGGRR
mmetsp:Transcript_19407/g.45139  ORF Transcript_19407/g.45139 Transcript_19407/m.45139 type:complete len:283 (+) Transcript_19407:230-1078(+)